MCSNPPRPGCGWLTFLPRTLLREIIANSCISRAWRNEDIVRTKFRLSLVLRAQKKPEEASTILDEIADSLKEARRVSTAREKYTDEDDMKLLDLGVSIFHGRTAGIWSNGTFW